MGEQNWITRRAAAAEDASAPKRMRRPVRFRRFSDLLLLPFYVLIVFPLRLAGSALQRLWRGSRRAPRAGSARAALSEERLQLSSIGQRVTPRVWAVRGLTLALGLCLLVSLFWFGVNFEQRDDPYANYRDQIEQVTGR
jgi:hypothetical protein